MPIEKKSASAASRSDRKADAGVSIIRPSGGRVVTPSSSAAAFSALRTARSSPSEATIGSMIEQAPLTRRMARSCVSNRSGRHRLVRIPRRPSAGFSSCGMGR